MLHMLPDGRYDAFVLWAEACDDGALAIELTIISGAHRGDVVRVRATRSVGDATAMIGVPVTLTVEKGLPHLDVDAIEGSRAGERDG